MLTRQQRGELSLALRQPFNAISEFEAALTHFANHPAGVVSLSNLLLDLYEEKLTPPPTIPQLDTTTDEASDAKTYCGLETPGLADQRRVPIGLTPPGSKPQSTARPAHGAASVPATAVSSPSTSASLTSLPPPYAITTTPLDRLAARDRAHGLLDALTKRGAGVGNVEAWFALARSYEVCGQLGKGRDVLWWVVELGTGQGIRGWNVVSGGYVL
jgi:hypothetical protein